MPPTPIFRFLLPPSDIITYYFDPGLRDEGGDGVVTLERISRPANVPLPANDPSAALTLYAEPKPGEEFYAYETRDGAEVRYQYDRESRNGKDYVAAVHREPENWMRMGARREDLGFKGEGVGFGRKQRMMDAERELQREMESERAREMQADTARLRELEKERERARARKRDSVVDVG